MVRIPMSLLVYGGLLGVGAWERSTPDRTRLLESEAKVAALEAEVARLTSEATEARLLREDFVATLLHELRTPLNAMLGWLQLLRIRSNDAAARERAIDVVERNAHAQAQIVSDLVDISSALGGRMTLDLIDVDLVAVVSDACGICAPAAQAKHIAIASSSTAPLAIVYGDAARLRQVVTNLVSNAIKFTPEHGRVTVNVSVTDLIGEITVIDDGVGITRELLPHVFESFRQGESGLARRFGGLGLGLALVRSIVELHGGSVEASSAGSGSGATLTVRLPLRQQPFHLVHH
jgi:signal transduction histidine kinase